MIPWQFTGQMTSSMMAGEIQEIHQYVRVLNIQNHIPSCFVTKKIAQSNMVSNSHWVAWSTSLKAFSPFQKLLSIFTFWFLSGNPLSTNGERKPDVNDLMMVLYDIDFGRSTPKPWLPKCSSSMNGFDVAVGSYAMYKMVGKDQLTFLKIQNNPDDLYIHLKDIHLIQQCDQHRKYIFRLFYWV